MTEPLFSLFQIPNHNSNWSWISPRIAETSILILYAKAWPHNKLEPEIGPFFNVTPLHQMTQNTSTYIRYRPVNCGCQCIFRRRCDEVRDGINISKGQNCNPYFTEPFKAWEECLNLVSGFLHFILAKMSSVISESDVGVRWQNRFLCSWAAIKGKVILLSFRFYIDSIYPIMKNFSLFYKGHTYIPS